MITLKNWAESERRVDLDKVQPVRLLLYGEAGAGKTRFALTAPDPFVLDYDRGLLTAQGMKLSPRFLSLSKGDALYAVTKDVLLSLRDGRPPFDTAPPGAVLLDSLTALAEGLLWEVMDRPPNPRVARKDPTGDKPEFDHWGILMNRLKELLDITKDLPCHVIATAGVKLEKDESLGTFVGRPSLPGSTREVVGHYFDEFFYMEPRGSGEKLKYMTYTVRRHYYAAKSRTGRPAEMENATFNELFKGLAK